VTDVIEEIELMASNKNNSATLELDLLVEGLDIAIEYEGAHHYFDVMLYGDRLIAWDTDVDKAYQCGARGLSLVEVPYWWDQRYESLDLTLKRVVAARNVN